MPVPEYPQPSRLPRNQYGAVLLPDAPLDEATEFAFVGPDRVPFVSAEKHEQVVRGHVAEAERLRDAIAEIAATTPDDATARLARQVLNAS